MDNLESRKEVKEDIDFDDNSLLALLGLQNSLEKEANKINDKHQELLESVLKEELYPKLEVYPQGSMMEISEVKAEYHKFNTNITPSKLESDNFNKEKEYDDNNNLPIKNHNNADFKCLFPDKHKEESKEFNSQTSLQNINLSSNQQKSIQTSNSNAHKHVQKTEKCVGCLKPITERYLLKVMNQSWHEDCLKCSCCNCRLGEVGSTLFTKANLMLCKRDYLRLFGTSGYCSSCTKAIPAFEMVMKAKNHVYHLDCFSCYYCNHRFCVGDRYYLHDNKILCEVDYEEKVNDNRLSSLNNNHAINNNSNNSLLITSLNLPFNSANYNNENSSQLKNKPYLNPRPQPPQAYNQLISSQPFQLQQQHYLQQQQQHHNNFVGSLNSRS